MCFFKKGDLPIMQTETLLHPKVYGLRGPARFLPAICLTVGILYGASAFLVMMPSIYQFIAMIVPTSQPAIIGTLLIISTIVIWSSSIYARIKLVISPEGLIYHSLFYSMYTPWENIIAIDHTTTRVGRLSIPTQGLKLRMGTMMDMTLEQGRENHIAVVALRWPAQNKRFRRNFHSDVFPLESSIVGQHWQEHEVGLYLRRYAPQLFEDYELINGATNQ
jgi:hypothetical protein